jgi:RNA polymerase sigma factor (sigma-70 family)
MIPTEEARFLALLQEHRAILYKVAFGYCRYREDRDDLVQEMSIQLWRSFCRYDGRVKFSTWAYRVAMNVAISLPRRRSAHSRHVAIRRGCLRARGR